MAQEGERYGYDRGNYRHHGADSAAAYLRGANLNIFYVRRIENVVSHGVQAKADRDYIYRKNNYGQFQTV